MAVQRTACTSCSRAAQTLSSWNLWTLLLSTVSADAQVVPWRLHGEGQQRQCRGRMYFLQQGSADVVIMGTVDASSKHGEHSHLLVSCGFVV
jgi:hypothetical protein